MLSAVWLPEGIATQHTSRPYMSTGMVDVTQTSAGKSEPVWLMYFVVAVVM